MPRLTKAAALAKAGYVPVIGRPKKEDTVPTRLPVSCRQIGEQAA